MQLAATRQGSFVAELTPGSSEMSESYGERALYALQRWEGGYNSSLPEAVVDRRYSPALPRDVRLWLGDAEDFRRVEIRRTRRALTYTPGTEELLYGWLKMVNQRTAQLHRFVRPLCAVAVRDLDDADARLATQFVEVRGTGRFNKNDWWQWVWVEQIVETRSWNEST